MRSPVEQFILSFLNDADIRTVLALRRFIRTHAVDIVLPTRSRDYWLTGFARMGTPAKYVMRMGITRDLRDTIKERLRYGSFPDGIVVNAEAVRQSLARYPWIKADRIRVIYNGVDPADTRPSVVGPLEAEPEARVHALKQPGDFLVIAAGRVESDKGFDTLVSAAAIAQMEIPRLRVVIFGRGYCEDPLRKQIHELGLEGIVRLGGFTRNLQAALAQADLAVSSSLREGVSNFILEAWSAGAPVIATSIPGSVEIITDGRGRLTPTGDAAQMAAAIIEAYRDPGLRARWKAGGRSAVDNVFNWNVMGDHLEAFLSRLSRPADKSA